MNSSQRASLLVSVKMSSASTVQPENLLSQENPQRPPTPALMEVRVRWLRVWTAQSATTLCSAYPARAPRKQCWSVVTSMTALIRFTSRISASFTTENRPPKTVSYSFRFPS